MLGKLPIHKDFSIDTLVYSQLNNESLLSIGQLCDNDCVAIFEKHKLSIIKNGQLIMKGTRNWPDRLWDVPFPQDTEHNINYIIPRD